MVSYQSSFAGLRFAWLLRRDRKKIKCLCSAIFNIPGIRDLPTGTERRICSSIRPRQQGLDIVLLCLCRRTFAARGDALDLI
jgi:hypothetical protein